MADILIQNYGAFMEKDGAGFRGKVVVTGFKNGDIDLSKSLWTHQVCNQIQGVICFSLAPSTSRCKIFSLTLPFLALVIISMFCN